MKFKSVHTKNAFKRVVTTSRVSELDRDGRYARKKCV